MSKPDITPQWLESVGFDVGTLSATRMLPMPAGLDDGAIVEMRVTPNTERDDWIVTLCQGLPHGDDQTLPDDVVVITSIYPRTRGQLSLLCLALGAPLKETPCLET